MKDLWNLLGLLLVPVVIISVGIYLINEEQFMPDPSYIAPSSYVEPESEDETARVLRGLLFHLMDVEYELREDPLQREDGLFRDRSWTYATAMRRESARSGFEECFDYSLVTKAWLLENEGTWEDVDLARFDCGTALAQQWCNAGQPGSFTQNARVCE